MGLNRPRVFRFSISFSFQTILNNLILNFWSNFLFFIISEEEEEEEEEGKFWIIRIFTGILNICFILQKRKKKSKTMIFLQTFANFCKPDNNLPAQPFVLSW